MTRKFFASLKKRTPGSTVLTEIFNTLLSPVIILLILWSVNFVYPARSSSGPFKIFFSKWQSGQLPNGKTNCNLYLQMDPSYFLKNDASPVASTQISASIFNQSGKCIEKINKNYPLPGLHPSVGNRTPFYLLTIPVKLSAGDYSVIFNIETAAKREIALRESFTINAPSGSDGRVSDILCAANIGADSREIIPFPAKIYGKFQPNFYVYLQLPPQTSADNVRRYQLEILDQRNIAVKQIGGLAGKDAILDSLDTGDIPPGDYELVCSLRDAGNRLLCRRQTKFHVHQDPADNRFFPLSGILEDIRLAMNAEEFSILEETESPAALKQKIADFWLEKDPTPGTARNELKERFYARLNFVKCNYWRNDTPTDRGLVFLQYGMPNAISDETDPILNIGSETWVYENFGKKITFREQGGQGEFRLVALSHKN